MIQFAGQRVPQTAFVWDRIRQSANQARRAITTERQTYLRC